MESLEQTRIQAPIRCAVCGGASRRDAYYCARCGRILATKASRRGSLLARGIVIGAATAGLLMTVLQSGPRAVTSVSDAPPVPAFAIKMACVWNADVESHKVFDVQYTVPASKWVDTGIYVPAGGSVRVESGGMWNPWHGHCADMGPEGVSNPSNDDRACMSANWGALIGRIGNDPYEKIGLHANLTTKTGGKLMIGMNDDFLSGATKDNTGSLAVDVSCMGPDSSEERMPLNMVGTPADIPAPRA